MRRPSATREALRFCPLVKAGWADASSVERVPRVTALAEPAVFLPGRPAAQWAAWDAEVLLLLNLAVWNDDRIVRNRTHARYYAPAG